jgi:hypothetical protein
MSPSWKSLLTFAHRALATVLIVAGTASGLEPPEPGKRGTTDEERKKAEEFAKRIGNQHVSTDLVESMKSREVRKRLEAAGWEPKAIDELQGSGLNPGGRSSLKVFVAFADQKFPKNAAANGSKEGQTVHCTLPNRRAAYEPAENTPRGWNAAMYYLLHQALNASTAAKLDLTRLDADGDNFLDNLEIVYAGPHGEPGTYWWEYTWRFQTEFAGKPIFAGKKAGRFSWRWNAPPQAPVPGGVPQRLVEPPPAN